MPVSRTRTLVQTAALVAICSLPLAAHTRVAQNSPLGLKTFSTPSHQGFAEANPLIAPGLAESLCHQGVRSRCSAKERDDESGLDYFLARYYSGGLGRFSSVDPLAASANPSLPQSWNRYAYVGNNPLAYVDPLGLFSSPAFNCSDQETACLNDEQRRILNNSTLTIDGQELSGEALFAELGVRRQNVFVNVTDDLGSITLKDGSSALSKVRSLQSGEGSVSRSFAKFNTDAGLKGSLLATGGFSEQFGQGNLRSTGRRIGGLEVSFDAQPGLDTAKIDIDIGNPTRPAGAIVHAGELIRNDVFGSVLEFFGGQRAATSQDTVRRILMNDPKVMITPSRDPKFNRKR